jgi:Rho GDP-dissociation inhibitor
MASAADDIEVEETPGYKAPAKVDLQTMQNLDADDEALNRWKAKLLEGASSGGWSEKSF